MPYSSRAYRVLIASPSDVEEEREIAVRVIQEWNDLHSYNRGVVLLPLRWETHTAPEYGTRPQEVINRAIVDQCDLLIGIFWTRIGTPTGAADSGTLEEITRVARAGKPVMLYFSKVGMDPDRLDLDQLTRLKTFKSDTYPNALTESYKSHIEFRDKFARQLELRVRDLQKTDTTGGPPPLALAIAAHDLKSIEGPKATREVTAIEVMDLDAGLGADAKKASRLKAAILAHVKRAATVPVVLAISNTGVSGIRNLYVEIELTASSEVDITDEEPSMPGHLAQLAWATLWETDSYEWKGPGTTWDKGPDLREGFKKTETGWRLTFEWPALQPDRKRLVSPAFFINSQRSGTITFVAKVFADSLPAPAVLDARLDIIVNRHAVHVVDLLGQEAIGG